MAIIGAGPAGLTAAFELGRLSSSHQVVVLEESDSIGGIARTEIYKGFRFDIGGHRFFTKVKEIEDLWHEICQDDFLLRPRVSRIHYRGKFYAYPLRPFNALRNIGAYETVRIALSYLKWRVRPHRRRRKFRAMGHEPLRRPPIPALLPHLHGEGLGHPLRRNSSRLG